ncbi:hypothetical protein CHLRE_01g040550v5 [Chlamydomonas reinhardtii]|uniref:Uncharacterized protein n=1 Tax=Chlamydomonas reinhardtii TaxID=3055 RepID=A0A2K3E7D6_CHLRE|nr:uncharacterized protein CHLRE_01g040550v5 [Chlamydomonas reinhardtii]PNW88692.1 hypothetical protein CHLRE_01g040550v5 [Chlamydomonas reinhardtii]
MVKIINGEIVADDDPRLRQRQVPQPGPPEAAHGGAGRGAYGTSGPGAGPGQQPGPGGAAAAGGAGGIGFNLSAPPLRFVPPPPGSDALGLPDMEVLGVRITPFAILGVVGLGMMLGWRGVLVALVLYYVYLANQGSNQQPGAPQQHEPHQQGAARLQGQRPAHGGNPMDFLHNYLNGPRPQPSAQRGPHADQGAAGPNRQQHYDAAAAAGHGRSQAPDPSTAAGGGGGQSGSGGWAAFQGQGQKLGKS